MLCRAEDLSPPPKSSLKIAKVAARDTNILDTPFPDFRAWAWPVLSTWIPATRQGRAGGDTDTQEMLGQNCSLCGIHSQILQWTPGSPCLTLLPLALGLSQRQRMDTLSAGRELSLCVNAPKEYSCLEGSPGQWKGRMSWKMSSEGSSSFWFKIPVLSIHRWQWDLLWDRGDSRSGLPVGFRAQCSP